MTTIKKEAIIHYDMVFEEGSNMHEFERLKDIFKDYPYIASALHRLQTSIQALLDKSPLDNLNLKEGGDM